MQFRTPQSKRLSHRQLAGRVSQFQVIGRSKKLVTCRTTPTYKCLGHFARPRRPLKIQRVCIDAHSPCRKIGSRGARLFTSAQPKACTRYSSTDRLSDTEPTVVYRANMTSLSFFKRVRTPLQFLYRDTAHSHMLKTKTSGGWRDYIVKFS